MNDDVDRVLINRDQVAARVLRIAEQVVDDFGPLTTRDDDCRVTLLAVLTGSLVFLADLIRQIPLMMRLRFLSVSSYPGTATRSRGPDIKGDLDRADFAGRHVLIVDDILDSGATLGTVQEKVRAFGPASVRTAVLLRKQTDAASGFPVDYVGFDIPDEFVVGYGLDYNGLYRNVPDIVTLKKRVWSPTCE